MKWDLVRRDFKKNKYIYLMVLPVIAFFIIFSYWPMYGVIIAFKDYSPGKGIFGSDWIGLKNFTDFFSSYYVGRLIRNTILINIYDLIWGFPAPIVLALLINEINSRVFKRTIQTISYLPHFISLVVVCGIIIDFTATDGLITTILSYFGVKPTNLLMRPELFRQFM